MFVISGLENYSILPIYYTFYHYIKVANIEVIFSSKYKLFAGNYWKGFVKLLIYFNDVIPYNVRYLMLFLIVNKEQLIEIRTLTLKYTK